MSLPGGDQERRSCRRGHFLVQPADADLAALRVWTVQPKHHLAVDRQILHWRRRGAQRKQFWLERECPRPKAAPSWRDTLHRHCWPGWAPRRPLCAFCRPERGALEGVFREIDHLRRRAAGLHIGPAAVRHPRGAIGCIVCADEPHRDHDRRIRCF